MKKLILGLSFLAIAATTTFVACKKDEMKKETNSKQTGGKEINSLMRPSGGGLLQVFNVQLHRKNGTKQGGVWEGKPCACTYCFGLCKPQPGVVSSDDVVSGNDNVVMENLLNGTAKIYILEQPDSDVNTDPTLYVHENIEISFLSNVSTISSGEYPFSNIGGTIIIGNTSHTYYGTAIVNLVP